MEEDENQLPLFDWANVERPKSVEVEEVKACDLDDPTCLSCGS